MIIYWTVQKNSADFSHSYLAGALQIAVDGRREIAFVNFLLPRRKNAPEWRLL